MTKLAQAPVVYTLCQVRFSPVLKMAEFIPEIQDNLRRDLPIYESHDLQTVKLAGASGQPSASQVTRWLFADRNRGTAFLLYQDSAVLITTDYEDFHDFNSRLKSVLQCIKNLAGVFLATRIGLRYIDFIEPTESLGLDELVGERFQGFEMPKTTPVFHQQDTFCLTQAGKLRVRLSRGEHKSVLPPDLDPILELEATPKTNVSIILDTDHYDDRTVDFDPDGICDIVDSLHAVTGDAFRTVVTKAALQEWK